MAHAVTQTSSNTARASTSGANSPPTIAGSLANGANGKSTPFTGPTLPNREKALQILSKSIYKELRENGYEPKQIVALATEIISLVTSEIGIEPLA
jgi:hypothetical protein